MATIELKNVNKIYEDNFHAVYDFNINIKDKEFIVFVGPSGCGKSTTLRMIAGLEDISTGTLLIDGKEMNNVEPKDRGIAMVFQNYALYPHMTVRNNMGFALEMRGMKKADIKQKVEEVAEILDLTELLDKKPKALSGGQRQRVALGRAIVREPKVFLMDEPLSNLDAKLRTSMRSEITNIHRKVGATTIYVTHDQTEAMTMADRIVIMKDGFIQQIGTPEELYSKPANLFVATFIGTPSMNIVDAPAKKNVVNVFGVDIKVEYSLTDKLFEIYKKKFDENVEDIKKLEEIIETKKSKKEKKKSGRKNHFSYEEQLKTKKEENSKIEETFRSGEYLIKFGVRPDDFAVSQKKANKSLSKSFDIKVNNIEMLGKDYLIYGEYSGKELIVNVPRKPEVAIGESISLCINLENIHLFDPITGERI